MFNTRFAQGARRAPHALACFSLALASASALAAPGDIAFTIDPAQSSVTATLSISLAGSDSDSSPVSGFIAVNTDCAAPVPGAASLLDFNIVADETVTLSLGNFITGFFDATIADTTVFYAGAGPIGPVLPDGSNAFVFPNVPAEQTGSGSYNATGLICTALQSQTVPLPCNDSFALAEEGTTILDAATVTISEISPGVYELTGELAFSRELDPDNPGLGTFDFAASIVATGTIEPCACPGDATGDGQVGTADLLVLLANWGGSTTNGDADGDFDNSGTVGTADLLILLAAWGTSC